jgi:2-haloacid dehalogenase
MAVAVKALFFDVFGTLVDWRNSIARDAKAMLEPKGYALDWLAFADAWRGEYQGAMDEVRSGRIAFCKLDVLHRRNLELVLPRFHVEGLSEAERYDLNLAWHRLDAWPDVSRGLHRLKRRRMICRGTPFSAPRSLATTSQSRASISPRPLRSICRPPSA